MESAGLCFPYLFAIGVHINKAVRFGGLEDIEKFKSVRVENGDTVGWDSLRQITIHEIIRMVERWKNFCRIMGKIGKKYRMR